MPRFIRIAAVADIPADGVRAFEHDGRRIAVYHVGGTFYATDDICSHAYAHLSDGWLDPDDGTVECPLHGSRFDLRTGAALTLPAFQPIAVYPVRAEGDDLLVELP
jgi:3-phenylpropionate/trans-cinnamate dioxygenase ferredoxin subunit